MRDPGHPRKYHGLILDVSSENHAKVLNEKIQQLKLEISKSKPIQEMSNLELNE